MGHAQLVEGVPLHVVPKPVSVVQTHEQVTFCEETETVDRPRYLLEGQVSRPYTLSPLPVVGCVEDRGSKGVGRGH